MGVTLVFQKFLVVCKYILHLFYFIDLQCNFILISCYSNVKGLLIANNYLVISKHDHHLVDSRARYTELSSYFTVTLYQPPLNKTCIMTKSVSLHHYQKFQVRLLLTLSNLQVQGLSLKVDYP